MEKALNVLKDLCLVINFNSYWKPRVEDAIAELEEAMKPKTCDGCKYEDGEIYKTLIEHGHNIHICSLCSRGTNDYFKPKDNAWQWKRWLIF